MTRIAGLSHEVEVDEPIVKYVVDACEHHLRLFCFEILVVNIRTFQRIIHISQHELCGCLVCENRVKASKLPLFDGNI